MSVDWHSILEASEIREEKVQNIPFKYYISTKKQNDGKNYAECNILDITGVSKDVRKFIDSIEGLNKLHEVVIGNKFYNYKSPIKYNIYFVIVVQDDYEIDHTLVHEFQQDYAETRKLFFTQLQAENYFNMQYLLKRESSKESKDKKTKNHEVTRIKKIKFNDYKHFESDLEIEFKQINLITSPNGGGKTSIGEAMKRLICNNEDIDNDNKVELTIGTSEGDKIISSELEFKAAKKQANFFSPEKIPEFKPNALQPHEITLNYAHNYDVRHRLIFEEIENFFKNIKALRAKMNKYIACTDYEYEIPLSGGLEKHIEHFEKFIKDAELLIEKVNNTPGHSEEKMKGGNYIYQYGRRITKSTVLLEELKSIKNAINSKDNLRIFEIYNLLTNGRDYKIEISPEELEELVLTGGNTKVKRRSSDDEIEFNAASTGQRACMSLAAMLSLFILDGGTPNFIFLDEPAVHLDPQHYLNLLDILRELALSQETQIFVASNNKHFEQLFRHKFEFMGSEKFKEISIIDGDVREK